MKKPLVMLAFVATVAQADAMQPDATYCLVCHGSNAHGSEVIGGPNLSILPDWYIKKQLKGFQQHWRGHQTQDSYGQEMLAVARTMTDDDISQAIHFIRTLPGKRAQTGKITGQPDNGRLHRFDIIACQIMAGNYIKPVQPAMVTAEKVIQHYRHHHLPDKMTGIW